MNNTLEGINSKISEEIIAENFPYMGKEIVSKVQEVESQAG